MRAHRATTDLSGESANTMKILICTVPIRPMPTDYPPFGSLAIIQSLREAGFAPVFYDIDGLRPPFEEVVERLRSEAPDWIGISAVVSTAYGYVKKLCEVIREVSPKTKIVLGGNLAASAELLHRFCKVDVCVVGEGEKIIVKLANYFLQHPDALDYSALKKINGLSFLDSNSDFVLTGYEEAIPGRELFDPDFTILKDNSKIDLFMSDPLSRLAFRRDRRTYEAHRVGKRLGTVVATKGCVARCTFCHRWDKGFRQIPPERVIGRIKHLIEHYNVGFIRFGDENFGSDRKATEEIVRLIKPLDILWCVAGVRACTVDLELLKRMRDAGCTGVLYGFESGSADILEVMEKKLELADNYNAARWMHEADLSTVYQLVLAMPGENNRTISETIEMVKSITEFLPDPPYKRLSINYIQALPGTPVYEYARTKGLIGASPAEEEEYLLEISDVNAGDDTKFLNFTASPYLTVQSWRMRILYEATVHWYRYRRSRNLAMHLAQDDLDRYEGGYFNRHYLVRRGHGLLALLFPIRLPLIFLWTLGSIYSRSEKRIFIQRLWEWLTWSFRKRVDFHDYRSMRHVMRDVAPKPASQNEVMMMPLRLGR
jgi:anaerobic magnesium-protoporphyrin IX monomethyl ester cyclase